MDDLLLLKGAPPLEHEDHYLPSVVFPVLTHSGHLESRYTIQKAKKATTVPGAKRFPDTGLPVLTLGHPGDSRGASSNPGPGPPRCGALGVHVVHIYVHAGRVLMPIKENK